MPEPYTFDRPSVQYLLDLNMTPLEVVQTFIDLSPNLHPTKTTTGDMFLMWLWDCGYRIVPRDLEKEHV